MALQPAAASEASTTRSDLAVARAESGKRTNDAARSSDSVWGHASAGTRSKAPPASWSSLVERIPTGDSAACEELYSAAFLDIRRWFSHRLGVQYADDRTHDTYLATIRAIINGDPREPDRLPGFIHVLATGISAPPSGAFARAGSARTRRIV